MTLESLIIKLIYKIGLNFWQQMIGVQIQSSAVLMWTSTVGLVVTSDTKGSGFKSSHKQFDVRYFLRAVEMKIEKKSGNEPFFKKFI